LSSSFNTTASIAGSSSLCGLGQPNIANTSPANSRRANEIETDDDVTSRRQSFVKNKNNDNNNDNNDNDNHDNHDNNNVEDWDNNKDTGVTVGFTDSNIGTSTQNLLKRYLVASQIDVHILACICMD
jgi:hypothetical protein